MHGARSERIPSGHARFPKAQLREFAQPPDSRDPGITILAVLERFQLSSPSPCLSCRRALPRLAVPALRNGAELSTADALRAHRNMHRLIHRRAGLSHAIRLYDACWGWSALCTGFENTGALWPKLETEQKDRNAIAMKVFMFISQSEFTIRYRKHNTNNKYFTNCTLRDIPQEKRETLHIPKSNIFPAVARSA